MSWWRDILRVLGLTTDARVHITAPDIEVVLTGDPELVRALLPVVKGELEVLAADRHKRSRRNRRLPSKEEQIVRPSELDEMDSPYAFPEVRVLPVGDSQITDDAIVRDDTLDEPATIRPPADAEADVLLQRPAVGPADSDDRPKPEVVGTKLESDPPDEYERGISDVFASQSGDDDEPEPEITAIAPNPSGPQPAQAREKPIAELATVEVHSPPRGTEAPDMPRRRSSFVTDNGPTLMPSESASEEVGERHDSDASSL